jgi:hypothetical protein
MKTGKLLLSLALLVFVAAGCNKGPSDSSSIYVPPPNPVVKEYGTVYVVNSRYYTYNIFIGGIQMGAFRSGTYVTRKVEPGICEIKGVQISDVKPGAKPDIRVQTITVVKNETSSITL